MNHGQPEHRVTGTDWVGIGAAVLGLLWWSLVAIKIQPAFTRMLADLGGPLPLLTRWCLQPWVPLVGGALPMVPVVEAIVRRLNATQRLMRMGVTLGLVVGLPLVFLGSLYLPVAALAAAVRSE